MKELEVKAVPLSELRPYEKNPRLNDNAVNAVAASLKEFGWKQPIVVDKDNVIIAGHTRWKAAKKLGLKTAPVVKADDLTPDQVKAYRLADNKTSEIAEWDLELLDEELAGIHMDMEQFGFDLVKEPPKPVPDLDKTNPTEALPESKVYFAAISAFGVQSECIIMAQIEQDVAERIVWRSKNEDPGWLADRLTEAINAI